MVLPLDLRFAGSNPAEDDRLLMAITLRHTTSFGRKIQPSPPPRHKILQRVKDPCGVRQRYLADKINGHFSPSFSLLCY
jgi:hypothetical protein